MRLADLWEDFRAGTPLRSKSQKVCYMRFVRDDPEYGDCILDENGFNETYFGIDRLEWLDVDDWEIATGPVKHKVWIGLFSDGQTYTESSEARVREYEALYAKNMLPLGSPRLIEVREVEWEVSE